MTYRCKSIIRVYEVGAEDRVYEAVSSSSHSGTTVRQVSGPELDIEVVDTRNTLDGTSPPRHTIRHLVVGIKELEDQATLEPLLEEGRPGARRYAVTDHETFGGSVMAGD